MRSSTGVEAPSGFVVALLTALSKVAGTGAPFGAAELLEVSLAEEAANYDLCAETPRETISLTVTLVTSTNPNRTNPAAQACWCQSS